MTTQSKSVLMPFLIIAGIVFAVALAWKYLGTKDAETAVEPAEVEMTAPVKTEQATTATTVEYNVPQPAFLEPIVEDREALRAQARSNMKFAMRYPSVEKSIAALKKFRSNGNDQAATDLISYINTSFPNDTIPTDLLD